MVTPESEKAYWIAFSVFPGIGPVRFRKLLEIFGSAATAWRATRRPLTEALGEKLADELIGFRKQFDIVSYLTKLETLHVGAVMLDDVKYPARLKEISDPPYVLYVRGRKEATPWDLTRAIAVVGTRKVTPYGREITERLVTGLVSYGFTIVSGLAFGVDAVAHKAAIDAGGKTIAVLGCGVDIAAPVSNARLYESIREGYGAIVSEMPLSLRPSKGLFPSRNRIISGLSMGVVVTEGAEDSGSLITARYAADQGREVFAVPGPITSPYSRGPIILIQNGASAVSSADDIASQLGISPVNRFAHDGAAGETDEERRIIAALVAGGRVHIDALVQETGLPGSALSAALTVLEVKGVVRDYGAKVYGLVE